jgi:hypothetical protein
MWSKFETETPVPGSKIVIVSERGASCYAAYVNKNGDILYAEDGESLSGGGWDRTTLWTYLPNDHPIQFMEQTDADWY